MDTINGLITVQTPDGAKDLSYKKLNPEIKPDKTFPIVKFRGYKSVYQMLSEMIITFPKLYFRNQLIEELFQLPENFIEVCYEYGTKIQILTTFAINIGKLFIDGELYSFRTEDLEDLGKGVGVYFISLNRIIINSDYINLPDYHPIYFFLAQSFQRAILDYRQDLPSYMILPSNKYKLVLFLQYAFSKGKKYFPENFKNYFIEDKKLQLKNEDRTFFNLLENYFTLSANKMLYDFNLP